MNPWTVEFGYLFFGLIFLIIGIIAGNLIIKGKHKKKSIKLPAFSLAISSLLLLMLIVFVASHPTYFKYNDWLILDSNINTIHQKYGDFDLGVVTDNKPGKVAYCIYTDNGPFMPDHLKHYYYMEYDEWGVINKVYEACQPGG